MKGDLGMVLNRSSFFMKGWIIASMMRFCIDHFNDSSVIEAIRPVCEMGLSHEAELCLWKKDFDSAAFIGCPWGSSFFHSCLVV